VDGGDVEAAFKLLLHIPGGKAAGPVHEKLYHLLLERCYSKPSFSQNVPYGTALTRVDAALP